MAETPTAPWDDERVLGGLDRQTQALEAALDAGASRLGWKVGFGAPASLQLMEITAPMPGFLTTGTLVESGATVDASDWERGVVEFELAVYLGSDVAPHPTDAEAAAAVEAVGPAIEVANIHLPVGPGHVADIVAANIFHEAVILGERDAARAGIDISGLVARISVDGTERAVTSELEAITGRYPTVVSTVATTIATRGHALRAGDVIITGSVIPPVPVTEGHRFTFALEPFEPIEILVDH